MKKITIKLENKRKPRNHLVALMASMRVGSGTHEKSHKAKRRADKMKLSKEYV
jgi:hypothetical protein